MPRLIATALVSSMCFLIGCVGSRRPAGAPQIYHPRANGEQQLARALAEAENGNKRVLLNLGANWCSDSQAMFRLLNTNAEIRRFVREYYVLAMVDVNKRDTAPRNTNVVARFGDPLTRGIPVLLILNADGTLLNKDADERLADSDHDDPARVLAYLRKWSTAP